MKVYIKNKLVTESPKKLSAKKLKELVVKHLKKRNHGYFRVFNKNTGKEISEEEYKRISKTASINILAPTIKAIKVINAVMNHKISLMAAAEQLENLS